VLLCHYIIVIEKVLLNDHLKGQTGSLKELYFVCVPSVGTLLRYSSTLSSESDIYCDFIAVFAKTYFPVWRSWIFILAIGGI
jgi:hypothetical protein